MQDKEIDAVSGVETTGHEWDGIKELNNPLPRWWLWTFYGTIIWAVGYMIAYPAIPLLEGATAGVLNYSSRAEVAAELDAAQQSKAALLTRLANTPVDRISADRELRTFSAAAGQSAFKVHCSQCHGSGAAGSPGYPNLNDDDWLWGGTISDIYQSITHGIRFDGDDDTRVSEMPAFGRDGILSNEQIAQAAAHVRRLAVLPFDADLAKAGEAVYAENCADCHGKQGQGNQELGSPRLTDPIWHYGDSQNQIAAQISDPKHGAMPAWGERLGDIAVKQLSVFVHGLGGGK